MKLDKYSDVKLDALLKEVKAEVERRKKIQLSTAKAEKELAALASKYGVETIKKLATKTRPLRKRRSAKKKIVVKPIYRNPDNPDQAWSGRGRAPAWVAEAESKHGGRDALRISNQED